MAPADVSPARCAPYAAGNGEQERYEGIWYAEWSLSSTPRPPSGAWGYRLYASRDEDAALGTVPRFGSDACFRADGEPAGEYTVTAAGDRTQTGEWGNAGFLFAWRSEGVDAWPPSGGTL